MVATSVGDHTPVLLAEVMDLFTPEPGDTLLDATIGLGGHASAFLAVSSPTGTVVGFDADATALAEAARRLQPFGDRYRLINSNFVSLKDSVVSATGTHDQGGGIVHGLIDHQIPSQFTHILFDLGIGSHQLADVNRGFSFASEAPLTMRYGDQTSLPLATFQPLNYLTERLGHLPDVAELIARLRENELAELIRIYGEERYAGRIARVIKEQPVATTAVELADRISSAVPAAYRHGRLHPATRTFQGLRLAVNRELEVVAETLPMARELLAPGGTLAVIAFHSLEDRIVKLDFRQAGEAYALLTKKPIRASQAEIARNKRSRSARLRALRKKE